MPSNRNEKTNAERFISAYNQIDYALRTIYGFKRSISYADLIRKSVPLNSVVRKYEDELIDYGRLRNSIVHKTNPNYVIAEPHIEVVEDFEKIAKIITTPPLAIDKVCKHQVKICDSSIKLKNLISLMSHDGYKNIPVYDGNTLKGVAIGLNILEIIGDKILQGENIEEFLERTPVSQVLSTIEDTKYFIEDVYDDPGRIVTVDLHGKVNVEKSLIVELYTTIVTLRNGLEAFLLSALKFLKDNNSLEESFETTIKNEIRYYHSFASKVGTILLSRKFIEINENANTYAQSYSKSHGNIDPRKDPKFNPDDDPSIRMLKNEFRKLNIALLTVLNNYDKDDEEFRFARNNVLSDSEIFSGKKLPTDVNAFFGIYTSYFDKIINNSRKEAEEGVHSLSADLREFEAARTKAKEEK